MKCERCPRRCGAERSRGEGYCGMPEEIHVAKVMVHEWEEPVICDGGGAGAIFFSGCNLKCVYCQNKAISRGQTGEAYSIESLADAMYELQGKGVRCIDLVTPTHYSDAIGQALRKVKPKLRIPVVYNCGGYESVEQLRRLEGLIDIYMPDFKYVSSELSEKYSGAADYCDIAVEALKEMYRQVGGVRYGADGRMTGGMIVRHLVLPGCRRDSVAVLEKLAEVLPPDEILLSLMSQYTPEFASDSGCRELMRRVTSFEYNYVLEAAERLNFNGFMQERASASAGYTPDFNK